jgi:hypothetical protein
MEYGAEPREARKTARTTALPLWEPLTLDSQDKPTNHEECDMTEDPRCCGSGTCIIDSTGRCWCGQQWDGDKMCFVSQTTNTDDSEATPQTDPDAD